jgi:hypothetical protein
VKTLLLTVLSVTITTIVGLVTGWLQNLVRRVWHGLHPDHSTIQCGWFYQHMGGSYRFYVSVRVAPSRRIKPARRRLEPQRVCQFVAKALPGQFPGEPKYSMPTEGIRFETSYPEAGPTERGVMWVWANGLVECSVPVTHDCDETGRPILNLVSLAPPILALVDAINSGWYRNLFGCSRLQRPHRLDWHVSLTPAISTAELGWTPFKALVFPGRTPAGQATDMYPTEPDNGYGGDRLRGCRQRLDSLEVLRTVFESLLERAGYWGYDEAVDDAIKASQRAIDNGVRSVGEVLSPPGARSATRAE